MKCPSCGAAVHPAADFCRLCGADAPVPTRDTSPRLRGIDALRSIRIPGVSGVRLPGSRPQLPQDGPAPDARPARSGRRGSPAPVGVGPSGGGSSGGASGAALHIGAPALATTSALPRVSSRVAVIGSAALAGLLLALLIVRVTFGASEAAQTARELAAARDAIAQRDAQISTLQGTISTTTQAQSELQTAAKTAQDTNATLVSERDEAKQRVTQLETKLMETQGKLTDTEATVAKQAADLKSLASCLNGTAVGLAFGRTNRWPSAEFALAAVADACKASESLLQQR